MSANTGSSINPCGPTLCGSKTCEEFGCIDTTMTPAQAKATPSESGHGLMLNGYTAYFPAIPCIHCGKFVGRDGHMNVEHFEMSSEIASVDGECRRCLDKPEVDR